MPFQPQIQGSRYPTVSNTVLKIHKHQYVKHDIVASTNTPSNSAAGKYKLGKYEISGFILPVSRNYTTKVTQCPDHFYFFFGQGGLLAGR
jgi:flavoprotein